MTKINITKNGITKTVDVGNQQVTPQIQMDIAKKLDEQGYFTPKKSEPNFLQNIAGGIVKPFENIAKTGGSIGSALLSSGVNALGGNIGGGSKNFQQEYKRARDINSNVSGATGLITNNDQKAIARDVTTGKGALQTVGDIGEAGINLIPVGKEIKTLSPFAKAILIGKQSAIIGAGQGLTHSIAEGDNVIDTLKNTALGGVLGGATGGALDLAGSGVSSVGKGIKNILPNSEKLAGKINNTIIKPSKKAYEYGRNPGEVMAKYGITGDLESIATKGSQIEKEIGQNINNTANLLDQKIKTNSSLKIKQATTQVQPQKILEENIKSSLSYLDEGIKNAHTDNNITLANKLQEIKDAITNNLSSEIDPDTGRYVQKNLGAKDFSNMDFTTAWDLKKKIGKLTNFSTGGDDGLIKVKDIMQKVYSSYNKGLENVAIKVDPELGKTWGSLSKDYSGILQVNKAAQDRFAVSERNNLLGLGDIGLGGIGALAGGITSGGDPSNTTMAGAVGIAFSILSKNPRVMTNLAKQLYKVSGKEKTALVEKALAKQYPSIWKKATPYLKNQMIQSIVRGANNN